MPIYMDRHDVSDSVTAENVAELHQQDLKVQDQFGCRGLTYWFDDVRKTAFCLIEAPSAEELKAMHDHAHGEVPHRIIEVDPSIVESFLGRIEDPVKAQNTRLNIINEPAFRLIMVVETEIQSLHDYQGQSFLTQIEAKEKRIREEIEKHDGRLVRHKDNRFLASFTSVTKAVHCALRIQAAEKEAWDKADRGMIRLKIGLSAGVPVSGKNQLFEDSVKLAEHMCQTNADIALTEEVSDLYASENVWHGNLNDQVLVLSDANKKFLTRLMEFVGHECVNAGLTVESFQRRLGLSKTQLYRKMIVLTGNSPNNFLLQYRLKRILQLLKNDDCSIAESAYAVGFNSPSYFAKCFRKVYGLSPTVYKSLI